MGDRSARSSSPRLNNPVTTLAKFAADFQSKDLESICEILVKARPSVFIAALDEPGD